MAQSKKNTLMLEIVLNQIGQFYDELLDNFSLKYCWKLKTCHYDYASINLKKDTSVFPFVLTEFWL